MNREPVRDLREAVRLERELRGDADYTIPEIVDAVERNYPEAVAEATHNSRRKIVTREVKAQIAPADDEQARLPGFEGVPLRISLPAEGGGYLYRSTYRATVADFDAHLRILDDGIRADKVRRERYADGIGRISEVLRDAGVARLCDLPLMPPTQRNTP